MNINSCTKKRSAGFSLLELVLVVAIALGMAGVTLTLKVQDAEVETTKQLGVELGQYNNAVREYLTELPATLAVSPMSFPVTFSGSAWLKDSTCGGSALKSYLPCTFGDKPSAFKDLGNYATTITQDAATGDYTAVTTVGPITINGRPRGDLAGQAAKTAAGLSPVSGSPLWSSTFASFAANDNPETGAGFTLDATGSVFARASTAPSTDAWLRTDGSNKMMANLNMNNHDVVDARDVYGKKFIDKTNNGFFVEPGSVSKVKGLEVYGADRAPGGGGVNEGLIQSDVSKAHAKVTSRYFEDLDNTTYKVDPSGSSNILDLTGRNATLTSSLRAPYLIDHNNANYYLNPNGSSNILDITGRNVTITSNLAASKLVDRDDSNYYIDPSWNSNFRHISAERVYAKRIDDLDNSKFYLDPSSESWINSLWVREWDSKKGKYKNYDVGNTLHTHEDRILKLENKKRYEGQWVTGRQIVCWIGGRAFRAGVDKYGVPWMSIDGYVSWRRGEHGNWRFGNQDVGIGITPSGMSAIWENQTCWTQWYSSGNKPFNP